MLQLILGRSISCALTYTSIVAEQRSNIPGQHTTTSNNLQEILLCSSQELGTVVNAWMALSENHLTALLTPSRATSARSSFARCRPQKQITPRCTISSQEAGDVMITHLKNPLHGSCSSCGRRACWLFPDLIAISPRTIQMVLNHGLKTSSSSKQAKPVNQVGSISGP